MTEDEILIIIGGSIGALLGIILHKVDAAKAETVEVLKNEIYWLRENIEDVEEMKHDIRKCERDINKLREENDE